MSFSLPLPAQERGISPAPRRSPVHFKRSLFSSAAGLDLVEFTNASGLRLQVDPGGGLFAIRHGSTLLNRTLAPLVEDGLTRLSARIAEGPERTVVPLIGRAVSGFSFSRTSLTARWTGRADGFEHETVLQLHPRRSLWRWRVRVRNAGSRPLTLALVYGQDLGLADENAVRNNEAYISHYLDHEPVETAAAGVVVLTRQNQAQAGGRHPWLAQGCLEGTAAFCTDGSQFFGPDYRLRTRPAAWDSLPSVRRQGEFAYVGLQSAAMDLAAGEERTVTYFGWYEPDHPARSSQADAERVLEGVAEARDWLPDDRNSGSRKHRPAATLFQQGPVVAGRPLTSLEWGRCFPGDWRHVEKHQGETLSFFYGEHRHVVARAKEAVIERPHGHILYGGGSLWPEPNALGTTVYAAGIFNAQTYFGNCNFDRFLSVVRDPLNVLRSSGQRIFLRDGGGWGQLGVPSAFEMGLGHARWIYAIGESLIEVRTQCLAGRRAVRLACKVLEGPAREFLVAHQIVLGCNELDTAGERLCCPAEGWIACRPEGGGDRRLFSIVVDDPEKIAALGGDELLYADGRPRQAPFAVVQTREVSACSLDLTASPDGGGLEDLAPAAAWEGAGEPAAPGLPLEEIRLAHPAAPAVARLGEILPWFAHDAKVHLAAPHGLEQYSGAAWGVRDVCQGPVEWLLAAQQFEDVRRILVTVFEQQYEDGQWPQWFMHPPYETVQQACAHGDVLFWPLKALGDYVGATGDFSILHEELRYTDERSFRRTRRAEPVFKHVDRVLAQWRRRCLAGTALVNYGDGDWDDTLQPSDPSLRSIMVSSWTVGLAYHAFRLWQDVCLRAGEAERAESLERILAAMRLDFRKFLIHNGSVCGFAVFEKEGVRPLLHPLDERTRIRHRLLPMTRGILAELFDAEEARRHAALIRDELLAPDGVRLMSDPVPYEGGLERMFKRATTAANFGREIGLQYVHAHIRYAEAMARLGDAESFWRALQVVNPVELQETVPHAARRQSNAYFSSSDGDFPDRYVAAREFARLREGTVAVKGGWRIYSSGPGLYANKVVTCLLGWRDRYGDAVIDPVLPKALDGLQVRLRRRGKNLRLVYRVREGTHHPRALIVNGTPLRGLAEEPNPYRRGGWILPSAVLDGILTQPENQVEVRL